MKASDTVVDTVGILAMVTDIEIMSLGGKDEALKALRCHLLNQAEISFKAGSKEVVDWMELEGYYYDYYNIKRYAIDSLKWQAKLKEWGIEVNK